MPALESFEAASIGLRPPENNLLGKTVTIISRSAPSRVENGRMVHFRHIGSMIRVLAL